MSLKTSVLEFLSRIREQRRVRKLADGPCTECKACTVFIMFADEALCSECYLQAIKDWMLKDHTDGKRQKC